MTGARIESEGLSERKQVPPAAPQPRMRTAVAEERVTLAIELIDRSGIDEIFDTRIDTARTTKRGAPATVSPRTVLIGILLALLDNRALYLSQAFSALEQLPRHLQIKVGFLRPGRPSEVKRGQLQSVISYTALTRTFTRMCDALGVSRKEPTAKGKGHRFAMSAGVAEVVDRLLEASILCAIDPNSGAIDSTGIHGHVNQYTSGDGIADSADPEVGWYVKEEKKISLLGYSLTIIVGRSEEDGSTVVLAIEVQSGNAHDAVSGTDLMRRGATNPNALRHIRQIAGDKAYSDGVDFFDAAQAAGKYVTFDANEHQRGLQAVHDGHPIIDGVPCCPAVDTEAADLGPAPSIANDVDPDEYARKSAKRAPFLLALFGRADTDGSCRGTCPVLAMKARCTRRPDESLAVDPSAPLIIPDDSTPTAAGCTQRTKSFPGRIENLQLQPQYPYGSDEWREAYGKPRSRVEGAFGNIKTGHGKVKRGGILLGGITKVALMLALNFAIENLRRCGAIVTLHHQDGRALRFKHLTEADFTPEGWARHQAELATVRDGRAPPAKSLQAR
jgi:hypothetical protein